MTASICFILGDLPATPSLGRCDAHEHLVLDGDFVAEHYPEMHLGDTDATVSELLRFKQSGGGWVVDSMPTGPGRNPAKLAEVSRQSGVPVVMSTGRHLAKYYELGDPHLTRHRESLRELFTDEIKQGVDGHRCGLIKVAGSKGGLTDHEREAFIAAAETQRATGCPIMTHTEADADGVWDQLRTLEDHGAQLNKVILSHLDKNPDVAMHRELLQTGVRVEYDQHFRRLLRSDIREPGPFDLITQLVTEYPGSVLFGMDMARRAYWQSRGGEPGLAWLVTDLPTGLLAAGLSLEQIDRCFCNNALEALSFIA